MTENTDEMNFGFMPGCGNTNAIFVLSQLQDKSSAKKKNLCFAFVDFVRTFKTIEQFCYLG